MTESLNRPYIICHMMMSLDGKIATGVKDVNLLDDDFYTDYIKAEDQLSGHAWMLGRTTMEMFAASTHTPLPPIDNNIDDQDFLTSFDNDYFLFATDTKGVLRFEKNTVKFFNVETPLNLVILVTKQTPKDYLSYLKNQNISYMFCGDSELDFHQAMTSIKSKFGVQKLLLEGGAHINGSVMAAGLIDEISLVLCPIVANFSLAPSLFELDDTHQFQPHSYSLVSSQQFDKGVFWFRYTRKQD